MRYNDRGPQKHPYLHTLFLLVKVLNNTTSSTTQYPPLSTYHFASLPFLPSLQNHPIFMATTTQKTPPTWPELLGSSDWDGLLDPLDLDLRRLILRCGDFIQATYDAFNNDQNSKYCGSSRYGKSTFFQKVMLENASDYKIASFLYATARVGVPEAFLLHSLSRQSWDRESNWIGYIAVTSDAASAAVGRREIYVVWRGTTRNYEWVNVLGASPVSARSLLSEETKKEIGENDKSSSSSSDDDDGNLEIS